MQTLWFIIQSMIIGVVEGITEFLPVSSTGHLIIVESLLGFQGENPHYVEMYTYVIQLGAILSVIVLYRKKFAQTLKNFFPSQVGYENSGLKFWLMIFIACIPGGILGILLDNLAEKYLFAPIPVAITLFVGALFMIICENHFRKKALLRNTVQKDWQVRPRQAWIIGLFQCLAIIPGMSRSASTIIGGWIAGLSTVAAAEFSFFLAIPVMVGMSALKLFKTEGLFTLTSLEVVALIVGFITAFISALFVIKGFINFLKRRPMRVFAVYRMFFAIIVLIAGFAGFFQT